MSQSCLTVHLPSPHFLWMLWDTVLKYLLKYPLLFLHPSIYLFHCRGNHIGHCDGFAKPLVTFAVKTGMTVAFFQSSGTSHDLYNLSKMIISSPTVASATSLNIHGWIPLGPADLWISTLPRWSLTQSSLTRRKFSLQNSLPWFPGSEIPESWSC